MSLRPRKKCSVALTQELLYRWKEHLISTMSTWRMKQVLMILNLISRKEFVSDLSSYNIVVRIENNFLVFCDHPYKLI